MKLTRISSLAAVAGASAILSWLLDRALTGAGQPQLTPQLPLPIVLSGLAVLVLVLALPIRKRLRGDPKPLSPFYATNVLILAKSSALTGAVFAGAAAGLLVFVLTLPVVVFDERGWVTLVTALAGLLLAVAGVIAEHFCRIPPSDDETQAQGPAPAAEA